MNAQQIFRQISTLYYALLAGQILFCLVLLFAVVDPETRQSGWPPAPFGLVIPIFFAGILPLAFFINKKRLATAAAEPGLIAKIEHYRTVVVLRSSLIEGANLFCLVVFLLENNTTYLIFFAVGMLAFLYLRPSTDEFKQHYQLSSVEKGEFIS